MTERKLTDLEEMEQRLTGHILTVLAEIKGGVCAYSSWDGRIYAEGRAAPKFNGPQRCWGSERGLRGKRELLEARDLIRKLYDHWVSSELDRTMPDSMRSLNDALEKISNVMIECCGWKYDGNVWRLAHDRVDAQGY